MLQAASLALALGALVRLPYPLPAGSHPVLIDVAVLVVVGGILACASAPWSWLRDITLERRLGTRTDEHLWLRLGEPGLPVRPVSWPWARRHLWQWMLTLATALPVWLLFQWLQRESPWLVVPAATATVLVGSLILLALAPWLITWSPRVTPLADEALAGRLHALVGRAGLRVAGLHAWRDGAAAAEPNAALLGAGPGRRLLLSTSLLETFQVEDIEVVVAHELGHHARGHIWRRMRARWVVTGVALAAAQLAALARATLTGGALADARALPLMLLAGGAVALLARPSWLTQSRVHELEADEFALQVTERPDVLERILTRIGAHYRTAPDPSPFEAAFFLTHPPVKERVTHVRTWRDGRVARAAPIE